MFALFYFLDSVVPLSTSVRFFFFSFTPQFCHTHLHLFSVLCYLHVIWYCSCFLHHVWFTSVFPQVCFFAFTSALLFNKVDRFLFYFILFFLFVVFLFLALHVSLHSWVLPLQTDIHALYPSKTVRKYFPFSVYCQIN